MKIFNTLLLVFLLSVLCLTENIRSNSLSKSRLNSKITKKKSTSKSTISVMSLQLPNGQKKKCPEPKYVDDKEVRLLISNLTKNKNDQEKISTIEDFITRNDGKPISASNSIKIIQNLNMNSRLPYVLGLLKNYFSITSKDLQTIMKNETNNISRIFILENLYMNLIDKDTVILNGILDSFECEEKTKFKVLLEKSIPKDCFFGDLNISKVLFVFDLSGSMDEIFTFDGVNYTRLEYLKENFIQAFENFNENQYYQIVTFSGNAKFLHGGSSKLIQATESNIKLTIDAVYDLEANGRTNIGQGLELAFKTNENIDEIFLFSDGAPTVGLQTINQFKDMISLQYKLRKSKNLNGPKINVNLLMLGGGETSIERKIANSISSAIATFTGGVVKYYGVD